MINQEPTPSPPLGFLKSKTPCTVMTRNYLKGLWLAGPLKTSPTFCLLPDLTPHTTHTLLKLKLHCKRTIQVVAHNGLATPSSQYV